MSFILDQIYSLIFNRYISYNSLIFNRYILVIRVIIAY